MLYNEGKCVLMYTVAWSTGWVILWKDHKGYTVSSVSGNNRSNGGALPMQKALAEFRDIVEGMIRRFPKRGES